MFQNPCIIFYHTISNPFRCQVQQELLETFEWQLRTMQAQTQPLQVAQYNGPQIYTLFEELLRDFTPRLQGSRAEGFVNPGISQNNVKHVVVSFCVRSLLKSTSQIKTKESPVTNPCESHCPAKSSRLCPEIARRTAVKKQRLEKRREDWYPGNEGCDFLRLLFSNSRICGCFGLAQNTFGSSHLQTEQIRLAFSFIHFRDSLAGSDGPPI